MSALCHACGYVQKLRADGTLGKHHIWIGSEYRGPCPGTGRQPAETSREQLGRFFEEMRRGN